MEKKEPLKTDNQVKNFKATGRVEKRAIEGVGGMYLQANEKGSKYWRLNYRFNGKQKTLALGKYPRVGLKEAKRLANEAKDAIHQGTDPAAERKRQKNQKQAESQNTFEALAREWVEQNGQWSDDHRHRVITSLEKDAFPVIGDRPITDIQPPELLAMIRRVENRDALELASRVLQRSTAVFRYAIQTGRATVNPAVELKGVLKTRKVQHVASVPRDALPGLIQAIEGYDGNPVTKYALQLLMRTFVRPGELRGARWDEIDGAEWRIPAERMKMGTEHIVPLSRQALAVLDDIRPFTGNGELVFPGERKQSQPISENTMTYALYRLGYKGRATPHGFRATASSVLNEQGFNPDAIERQLSHIERNNVRAAYTHHARYLDERRKMMQWWANYLDSLNSNVVPFKTA